MSDTTTFTIGQISKELGVSTRILNRYFEHGLVPGAPRFTSGKRRAITPEQLTWLRRATYLHRAGLPMNALRQYVRLCQRQDAAALKQRTALLRTHKRQVWQKLEDLQATIDFLEREEESLASA